MSLRVLSFHLNSPRDLKTRNDMMDCTLFKPILFASITIVFLSYLTGDSVTQINLPGL